MIFIKGFCINIKNNRYKDKYIYILYADLRKDPNGKNNHIRCRTI